MVAASVDPPGRVAAFARRWGIPFPIVGDPGGDRLLGPLGLLVHHDAHGEIAAPTVIVLAPDGREVYRHRSRDFADRPDDSDVLEALESLSLGPIVGVAPWVPDAGPEPSPGAFTPERFHPYFTGVAESAKALAGRMESPRDRKEAETVSAMARSFLSVWASRRRAAA